MTVLLSCVLVVGLVVNAAPMLSDSLYLFVLSGIVLSCRGHCGHQFIRATETRKPGKERNIMENDGGRV